jgi:histidyl-tRNA synthetase
MEELKLFPDAISAGTQVLFFNLGESESRHAFVLMQQLRSKGIACELFHESAKFDKQFKYAEKKNIPHIVIIGSEEAASQTCTVKTLATGTQQTIAQKDLLNFSF